MNSNNIGNCHGVGHLGKSNSGWIVTSNSNNDSLNSNNNGPNPPLHNQHNQQLSQSQQQGLALAPPIVATQPMHQINNNMHFPAHYGGTIIPNGVIHTSQQHTTQSIMNTNQTQRQQQQQQQSSCGGLNNNTIPIAPAPFMHQQQTPQALLNPLLKTNAAAALAMQTLPLTGPTSFFPVPPPTIDGNIMGGVTSNSSNSKLRAGKWIPEEEEYALILIRFFEKGYVSDCENGATLRSYLSTKLNCAPMRISKKFAGKGIGKMIYSGKMKSPPQDEEKKLKDLQQKYYNAANPTPSFYHHGLPFGMPPGAFFPGAFNMNPVVAPMTTTTPAAITTAAMHPQQPQQQQQLAIGTNNSAPLTQPTPPTVPNQTSTHAKQLQESYQKALQDHGRIPQQQTCITTANPEPPPQQVITNVKVPPPSQQQQQQKSPQPSTNTAQHEAVCANNRGQSSENRTSSKVPNGIPPQFNLLAGFDKIIQKSAATASRHGADSQEETNKYTPTFTSRSFDDLHQFLGKDMNLDSPIRKQAPKTICAVRATKSSPPSPSFGQIITSGNNESRNNNNKNKNEISKSNNTKNKGSPPLPAITVHDTTALFSAESYAIFAQESAIEASQHAAYLLHTAVAAAAAGVKKDHHLDVDGMLQMVSEHAYGQPKNNKVTQSQDDDKEEKPGSDSTIQNANNTNQVRLTPVERMLGTMSSSAGSAVMISDPSAASSEAFGSSEQGSGESNGGFSSSGMDNTSNEDDSEEIDDSHSDSNSSTDNGHHHHSSQNHHHHHQRKMKRNSNSYSNNTDQHDLKLPAASKKRKIDDNVCWNESNNNGGQQQQQQRSVQFHDEQQRKC